MSIADLIRQLFAEIDEAEEIGVPVDEIVSLVEAAEGIVGAGWIKGEDEGDPTALALGRALTALNNHLEGEA